MIQRECSNLTQSYLRVDPFDVPCQCIPYLDLIACWCVEGHLMLYVLATYGNKIIHRIRVVVLVVLVARYTTTSEYQLKWLMDVTKRLGVELVLLIIRLNAELLYAIEFLSVPYLDLPLGVQRNDLRRTLNDLHSN